MLCQLGDQPVDSSGRGRGGILERAARKRCHGPGELHRVTPSAGMSRRGGLHSRTSTKRAGLISAVAAIGVGVAVLLAFTIVWVTGGPGPAGGAIDLSSAPSDFLPMVAVARGATVDLFRAPAAGDEVSSLPGADKIGVRAVFLVKQLESSWVQVYVPERPNGSTAWVEEAQVALQPDPYEVVASISRRSLVVIDGGRVALQVPIAVGASSTPTPLGTFFITELLKQPDPHGVYGPYAYGLSAFSNVLLHFGGGPGQIGLHGTNDPTSIGTASSHGCLRVANPVIERLIGFLPLGTPVVLVQ